MTSNVGGVKEKEREKEKGQSMLMDPPTIKTSTASSKEYSGDTAMVQNDSTKKQVPAPVNPVVQQPHIFSISISTPSRKASIKSSASTPRKSPGICSISRTPAIHATVLQAGGRTPAERSCLIRDGMHRRSRRWVAVC